MNLIDQQINTYCENISDSDSNLLIELKEYTIDLINNMDSDFKTMCDLWKQTQRESKIRVTLEAKREKAQQTIQQFTHKFNYDSSKIVELIYFYELTEFHDSDSRIIETITFSTIPAFRAVTRTHEKMEHKDVVL